MIVTLVGRRGHTVTAASPREPHVQEVQPLTRGQGAHGSNDGPSCAAVIKPRSLIFADAP
jgi:hypothetical protein